MIEALPDGGTIRKIWSGEAYLYRDHLLRLDGDSRRTRFSAGVSDAFLAKHAATISRAGTVVHGFLINGELRGAAELRRTGSALSTEAEVGISVEKRWQSHGVGTALLERTLLVARNRGIKTVQMQCLAGNRRMQQLAAKFAADFTFQTGNVVGEVDAPRSTPMSLMREMMEDGTSVTNAIIEAQRKLFKLA
jgi:GNAT superfamily N-acetyltransferase